MAIRLVPFKKEMYKNFEDYCLPSLYENGELSEAVKDMPLFSVVMFNFMKQAVMTKGFDEIANYVINNIHETQVANGVPKGSAYFSLYRCLGSADMTLLCRSNNFSSVFNVIYKLRAQPNLISAYYFKPCILPSCYLNWHNEKIIDKMTRLSIRVHFNPANDGSAVSKFIRDFKRNMKQHNIIDPEISFSRLSGQSELLILTGISASEYAPVYFSQEKGKEGVLSWGKRASDSDILRLRTTVRMEVEHKDDILEFNADVPPFIDGVESDTPHFSEAFVKGIKDKLWKITEEIFNDEQRYYEGFMQMLNVYLEIAEQSHNYDMRSVMGAVFKTFYALLGYMEDDLDNPKNDITDIKRKNLSELNRFREYFSHVLNDFSAATLGLVEGRVLAHKVMGNSQKLILHWSWLVAQLSRYTNSGCDTDKVFLVTSGGTDAISADLYFKCLRNVNPDRRNMFVALSIPENRLYKTDTLFFILHEYAHHAGDRLREKRAEILPEFLTGKIAISVSDILIYTVLDGSNKMLHNYAYTTLDLKKFHTYMVEFVKGVLHGRLKSKMAEKGLINRNGKADKCFHRLEKAFVSLLPLLSDILTPTRREGFFEEIAREFFAKHIMFCMGYPFKAAEPARINECKTFCELMEHDQLDGFKRMGSLLWLNLHAQLDEYMHIFKRNSIYTDISACRDLLRESNADCFSTTLLDFHEDNLEKYIRIIAPSHKTLKHFFADAGSNGSSIFSVMNTIAVFPTAKKLPKEYSDARTMGGLFRRLLDKALCVNKVSTSDRMLIVDHLAVPYEEYARLREVYRPLEEYVENCRRNVQETIDAADNKNFKIFVEKLRNFHKFTDIELMDEIFEIQRRFAIEDESLCLTG